MNRKSFLTVFSISLPFFQGKTMTLLNQTPILRHFEDDGKIPNSKMPLLIYKRAFSGVSAKIVRQHFANNGWTNSWKNGVYSFHHYHSTSHEVLGVYSGKALLHLGGENGEKFEVETGDVIVI